MKPDDRFVFETFETPHGLVERIRIDGSRITIDSVVSAYKEGRSAEEITRNIYSSLTVEQAQSAIDYYEQNRSELEAYFERREKIAEAFYEQYKQQGPYFLKEEALRRAATTNSDNG